MDIIITPFEWNKGLANWIREERGGFLCNVIVFFYIKFVA